MQTMPTHAHELLPLNASCHDCNEHVIFRQVNSGLSSSACPSTPHGLPQSGALISFYGSNLLTIVSIVFPATRLLLGRESSAGSSRGPAERLASRTMRRPPPGAGRMQFNKFGDVSPHKFNYVHARNIHSLRKMSDNHEDAEGRLQGADLGGSELEVHPPT